MDISDIRRNNLRLIIERHFAGTAVELARALGKQPSEISRIFSVNPAHRRNLGSRLARRIEAALGKEAGWMDRQQAAAWDDAAPPAPAGGTPLSDLRYRIPVISSVEAKDASAPRASLGPSATPPREWIVATRRVGGRAYALRVVGDSMEPKFPDGVNIIVDPDVRPVHGSFVVAHLADTDQITFKQLVVDGRSYLKPLNPRYPVMEVDDGVTICGVVRQMIMNFD
jgi:SOS-response transcriptional repressor LexA